MEELEKSLVVAVFEPERKEYEINQVLEEMQLLTESAGGEVLASFAQKRRAPDIRYLIGKGKAAEIKNMAYAKKVKLIIFYNRLSNTQQRNLERFFKLKVVDRTGLILDIFATRARSLAGQLQVELAQLMYMLPRLSGKGVTLSRLGGGIGTRGPGETKLEVDRRTINKRIARIKKKIEKVARIRTVQRQGRKSNPVPVVSLVGYTSAGKSTLFKALTGQEVTISPLLFSTLDPLLRRVDLSEIQKGYSFLLSDTVGFIRDMPSELFQAFQATLEEVIQADIIFLVVDAADPDYLARRDEVWKVLELMKIPENKVFLVYNKMDLVTAAPDVTDTTTDTAFNTPAPRSCFISAKCGTGLLDLKKMVYQDYFSDYRPYTLTIPPHSLNPESVKKWAIVLSKQFLDDCMVMEILCSTENMVKFKEKYGGYVK